MSVTLHAALIIQCREGNIMKSKILWIGLAVVLVVVILVTRVISNLDGIVAGIIEHVGSDVC